jgi:uncharacterized protein YjaG (DUF416 family)
VTRPSFRYHEPSLVQALSRLSPSISALFAATCAERVLPVYRWFHRRTGRGDPAALEEALGALWSDLEGQPSKALLTAQKTAEGLVPEEDDTWVDECAFAQHAAAAVAYAIRCHLTKNAEEAGWAARQVYEALDLWVTTRANVDLNAPGAEDQVLADPLIQAELARQSRDIAELMRLTHDGVASVVPRIRQRAQSEASEVFDFPEE